jgi:hypothetical protein
MLECEFCGIINRIMSQHFEKPCLAGNWFRHLFMNASSINPLPPQETHEIVLLGFSASADA